MRLRILSEDDVRSVLGMADAIDIQIQRFRPDRGQVPGIGRAGNDRIAATAGSQGVEQLTLSRKRLCRQVFHPRANYAFGGFDADVFDQHRD